ncbi:HIV-1 Vpr-binding protein [Trypanosoma conorhini]|uniref:HIV-1 Vpr-binding protein n=1 Tax=Trypanosoma conorhini TaxID=83891 RepID=A0A422PBP9_9TRYP|nr:HIV-1 Vpr-binding protein [Trypanosoma conorhini]RNF15135.1 HIV-1 Vpr-binding protein [Trypanosoma conorhini]
MNDAEVDPPQIDDGRDNEALGSSYGSDQHDTEVFSYDEEDMIVGSPSIDLVKELMKRLLKVQKQMKVVAQNIQSLLNGTSSELQSLAVNNENTMESTVSLLRQYDEIHLFLWGRMAKLLHEEHQQCADVYTDTLNLHDRLPFESLTHTIHHNTAFCEYMGELININMQLADTFTNSENEPLKQIMSQHIKTLEKSQILANFAALLVVEGSRESFLDPLSMYDLCKVIVEEENRRKRLLALSLSFSMLEQDDQAIVEALSQQLPQILLQRSRHLVHRIFGYPGKQNLTNPREGKGSPFRYYSAVIQSNPTSPISSRRASPEVVGRNTTTAAGVAPPSSSASAPMNNDSPSSDTANARMDTASEIQIREREITNTGYEKHLFSRIKNARENQEGESAERPAKRRRLEGANRETDYQEEIEYWQPQKGEKVGRGPAWGFENQAEDCDVGEVLGVTTTDEILVKWLRNVDSAADNDTKPRVFRYKYKKPHDEVVLWQRFLTMKTMRAEDIDFKLEEFMLNCAVIGAICHQREAILPALQFQAIESMIQVLDSVDLAAAAAKAITAEKNADARERTLLGMEEEDGAVDEDALEIRLRWDTILHNTKEHYRQTREIVARVGWVLNALLSHRKLALVFLELGGLRRIMTLIDANLEVSTNYGCCIVLSQLARSSVFEKLLRNHGEYFEPVMSFILHHWKNASSQDVQSSAGGFLFQALSFPCVISFFDMHGGPQATMSTIERLLNSSEEQFDVFYPGLTLAALKCFYVYLVSHLMLCTRVLFRKHQFLSALVTNSSQGTSLPREPATVEWILSFLSFTSASIPDVSIETVHSLLTRERLVIFRTLIENNFHQLLLRCTQFYFTQGRWELLAASLNVLCVLSVVPFVRPLIADARYPESGIVHLIMIVSDLAAASRNGNTSRESHLIPCVATALQILLHLTVPPIDKTDEASVAAFNQICSIIRASDGVRTLLEVLKIRKDAAMSAKLHIFPVIARALQLMVTLRRYADTSLLFDALGVSLVARELLKQYEDVQKEFISMMGSRHTTSDVHATGRFMENVKCFILDKANQAALTVSVDSLELERRQAIIARSHISYSRESLLELISRYLESEGLQNSASVLRHDAHLSSDASHLQTSMHATTDVAALPTIGAPTLDGIIRSYLRQQHENCTNPISTLPQFDLRKSHVYYPLTAVDHTRNAFSRGLAKKMGSDFSLRMRNNENHFIYRHPGHLFDISCDDDGMQGEAIAFCDGGDTLIVGTTEGAIALFDTFPDDSSGEKLLEQHLVFDNNSVAGVFVSGNGEMLAILSSEDTVAVMRRDTLPVVKYSVEDSRAARFSTSNEFLLTTCHEPHTCRLYDISAQQEVRQFSDPSWVGENWDNVATFDAFSQLILSDAVLWDIRCGDKPIYRFDRFTESFCNAFHPSNLLVLIDEKIWDLRTLTMLQTVPDFKKTSSFHVNPFGEVIYSFRSVSLSENSDCPVLSVVESHTLETIFSTELRPPFREFAIDPSGRYCAAIVAPDVEPVVRMFSASSGPLPGQQSFSFPRGSGDHASEEDIGVDEDVDEDELDRDSFWSSSDADETDEESDDDSSGVARQGQTSESNDTRTVSGSTSDDTRASVENGTPLATEDDTMEGEESGEVAEGTETSSDGSMSST